MEWNEIVAICVIVGAVAIVVFGIWYAVSGINRQLKKVEKLTDQNKLADIAKKAFNLSVRIAAADKLTDRSLAQKVYIDIATNKSPSSEAVRMLAAEKLTDKSLAQKIYIDIATNVSNNEGIRMLVADEKLTDKSLAQKVYLDIAANAYSEDTRKRAAEKLTGKTPAQNLKAEQKSAEQCVSQLTRILDNENPQKNTSPEVGAKIRAIGQNLANIGGFELMKEVYEELSYTHRQVVSILSVFWDGIDRWRH